MKRFLGKTTSILYYLPNARTFEVVWFGQSITGCIATDILKPLPPQGTICVCDIQISADCLNNLIFELIKCEAVI